ncbi:MAG TPA: hypothetical protein VKI61_01670, partial [Chitinophagaceae bacterium]|nr:hypothetical protein [Chitinophagaceae bacterium]
MKRLIVILSGIIVFSSCGNNHIPDVSGIKVDATIARFDKDFFGADTNNTIQSLDEVQKKYPYFFTDFIQNVVVGGSTDTLHDLATMLNAYINHSRPLFDSVQKKFSSLDNIDAQLQMGFQFVKYYYPDYKLPKLVTYSGLIGDPSVALTKEAMAIGLQMYLGKDFSAYNTPEAIDKFPQYISRRFEPAYIPVNCLQNIALDIYPEKPPGQTMIEQIIEKGKQWYLIDKFLPAAADSLKTGFTQNQLDWCKSNEGLIWNNIVQNNDIFTTEPSTIKDFIGEAPTTDGMPAASPGNIGQWIGWQIVKTYADKYSNLTLQQVLQTDAKK